MTQDVTVNWQWAAVLSSWRASTWRGQPALPNQRKAWAQAGMFVAADETRRSLRRALSLHARFPMPALPLSLSIISMNEEANLRRCLASAADLVSEIVVVNWAPKTRPATSRAIGARVQHRVWLSHRDQKRGAGPVHPAVGAGAGLR